MIVLRHMKMLREPKRTVRAAKMSDFNHFSNESGSKLPTLTLPEDILGTFWLAECLQCLRMQITDVEFTDHKWFWELFRYFFADFGLK